jgi:hypothetical protein
MNDPISLPDAPGIIPSNIFNDPNYQDTQPHTLPGLFSDTSDVALESVDFQYSLKKHIQENIKTKLQEQLYNSDDELERLLRDSPIATQSDDPEYSTEDPNWPSWIPKFPPDFIGKYGDDVWIFDPRDGLWHHILYTFYDTIIIRNKTPSRSPPGGHLYWRPGMD